MGLFDKLLGRKDAGATVTKPASVGCEGAPNTVYAPSAGTVVAMADIPDPVFASGAMGPAVGVKPSEGVVYAPVSGEVTVTTPTLHALGIMSHDGVEILIHVGVDTVEMKGDGFTGFVEKGAFVKAGEPLVAMDLDKIAKAGHEDVVITVVTNADDLASVEPAASGPVEAGVALMAVEK